MIIYIIQKPKREKHDEYKLQCLKKYASYIHYDQDIQIQIGKQGKPFIINDPFYFNVSHSHDYYLIACSQFPIGIDIEQHRTHHYLDIAKRFYTIQEYNYVQKYQKQGFFDIWCMKESYTKYLGKSIFQTVKHFNTCHNDKLISQYQDLYFIKYFIDKNYSCYIVTDHHEMIKEVYMN